MKKYLSITIMLFSIAVISCKKNNISPAGRIDDTIDTATTTLAYEGMFNNGPYGTVTGTVRIYEENNIYKLALVNFTTSNGPDLHLYLSKEVQPINFIDFGKIKSTNGNQVYAVAGKPNLAEYKFVLIHCQQYNHLFGSAALK